MKLLLLCAGLVVLTVLWLLWLWAREAHREGQALPLPILLSGILAPVLGVVVYVGLGYQQDTGDWLGDYQALHPVASQLIAGQPPAALPQDIPPAALVRVLQRQLVISPSVEGWYALGLLYGQLGAPNMAVEAGRRAMAGQPGSVSARMLVAQNLIEEREGRMSDEALALLRGVIADQPQHDGAWMLLGMGASRNRDYPLAEEAWTELLRRHGEGEAASVLERSLAFARSQQASAERFADVSIRVTTEGDVPPGGSLFVFLRDPAEPGQPLAARRVLAERFPVRVTLRAQDWLQAYPDKDSEVVAGARYNPAPAAGVDQAPFDAPHVGFSRGEVEVRLQRRDAL
ncbi:cytochrome C biogenesis protein [Alcanivorax sp. JB21]|uniref:tetratricopeptide repeat protein n=1 Tax=Alcanivorax limicola TaxID=2874102 RepID=UPI001CBF0605|nr:cytochrome C biogenesis protein [Alcanivorax limicola]MBZ2189856.1 cytochrome C biogenesis protein [Alcanivorax limicola]